LVSLFILIFLGIKLTSEQENEQLSLDALTLAGQEEEEKKEESKITSSSKLFKVLIIVKLVEQIERDDIIEKHLSHLSTHSKNLK